MSNISLSLILLLMCACSTRPTSLMPALKVESLPSANLSIQIPQLGPCTDSANRELHLDTTSPVIILAHGCFSSAGRFRALAQVFAFHGQQTVCFSYDDRDSLMVSSAQLITAIESLAEKMQNKHFTVIGHSQGGLVARKALVRERDRVLQNRDIVLELITVSSPFAGIAAADHCASRWGRYLSLGITALICQWVTGDKWRDITYKSPFIQEPGHLLPQTLRHLKIITDERNSCRRYNTHGDCVQDDFVFSLTEQYYAPLDRQASVTNIETHAGHVEIIGNDRTIPHKLIEILQAQHILHATPIKQRTSLNLLLKRLYME